MDNYYRNRDRGKKMKIVSRILLFAEIASMVLVAFFLKKQDILPDMSYLLMIIVFALIVVFQCTLIMRKRFKKWKHVFSIVLSCVLTAALLFAFFYMNNIYSKLEKLTVPKATVTESESVAETEDKAEVTKSAAAPKMTTTMNVFVRIDDKYKDLKDLKGKTFGIMEVMDKKNTENAVEYISGELGEDIKTSVQPGILGLTEALKNKKVDAFVVNSGYETAITDNDESFYQWAVLLCSVDVEAAPLEDNSKTASVGDVSVEPFLVYISGMDTRGDQIVAEVGNSDVNILMAVNPSTHKVLLINVPRDYYYYLWGDQNYPDKLTHSGYYGIDCGIETLDSLFDSSINYYVRVGFNSVINIVDALGGIDVNSDYTFDIEGYHFDAGVNHLDGMAALQFSRERMSLPGGDRARGANQEEVISAIIGKMTSSALITNLDPVLDAIVNNVVTNFSVEDMNALIKMQLTDNPEWEVTKIAVDGAGDWQYCYSLGSANDVMIPDWSTVDAAKEQLKALMSGQ